MRARLFRSAALLPFVLLLGGCSADPAQQAPVELKPGLYAVALAAKAYLPMLQTDADSDDQKKVCVSALGAESFPRTFPGKYLSNMGSDCDGSGAKRTGNHVTGAVSCALADGLEGELGFDYEAIVAAESMDIRATMNFENLGEAGKDIDTSVLEDMALRIRLDRVGDCTA